MWGFLPAHYYASSKMRWSLGAKDIMFTNPIYSSFFKAGRVISIERGAGIYQEGMNDSIKKLNQGDWIHIFPEGKVSKNGELMRFKWGIARLVVEAQESPLIIPIRVSGVDKIKPCNQFFPNFKLGMDFRMTVGDPFIIDRTKTINLRKNEQRIEIMKEIEHKFKTIKINMN
jgi:monolysocardiolipin acyltransferase